ncbi:MAG: SDR family oxidoreductase [Deltaproteobacteria bacterium]|jgi:3-oxoacyl-[acyl-carrier protein] reductase|nr:SDR family oxidoreductase [Deltaproteobacteria bacterium]
MQKRLNEVALVTGASRGIGRAISVQLAGDGFDLCLVARGREKLEQTARRCHKTNPKIRILILPCDLTLLEEIPGIVAKCVKQLKGLDLLVNNAGMNVQNVCSSASMETWDRELTLNLLTPMHLSHFAAPHLINSGSKGSARRGGHVIMICSLISKTRPVAGMSAYTCTKYGLRGFGYGIFEDLRERGVSVTNIYPSLTNTELGSQFRREFSDLCGLSQDEMLKPSDIAQSVSFAVKESRRPTSCVVEMVIDSQLPLFLQNKEALQHELAHIEDALKQVSTLSVEENVAIVTGGSRGIGEAAAFALAKGGIKKIALVARNVAILREAADKIERLVPGTECLPLSADITDATAAQGAVSECIHKLGGISVLVNSAGINRRCSVVSSDPRIWDEVYCLNLKGSMDMTRLCLPYLVASRRSGLLSSVIFINSIISLTNVGTAGEASYYFTKMGLRGFAQCLWEDTRHLGVKVTSILPSLVSTPLGRKTGPTPYVQTKEMIAPEAVGEAVRYAAQTSHSCCPTEIAIETQHNLYKIFQEYDKAIVEEKQ